MEYLQSRFEYAITSIMIWLLKRGYGADCKSLDYIDFPEHSHELNGIGRCPSCQANEVIKFLELHLELL